MRFIYVTMALQRMVIVADMLMTLFERLKMPIPGAFHNEARRYPSYRGASHLEKPDATRGECY